MIWVLYHSMQYCPKCIMYVYKLNFRNISKHIILTMTCMWGWSQGWNPGDNDTDFIYSDLGKPQCGKECHHIEFSDGDTVEEKKKKIRDAVDHTKIEWKWGKRNGQKRTILY